MKVKIREKKVLKGHKSRYPECPEKYFLWWDAFAYMPHLRLREIQNQVL